ncbi:MAG: hypothetical protein LT070_12220 [Solirubrobacteraceae bacterium]|nr:hypothetical protein [Solirubrobacteraceae bacterium]
MTYPSRVVLVATATAAALTAPAVSAQAATRTVDVGTPPASQKAFQKVGADVNAFFPRSVTVRAGDRLRFVPDGFHTVDLPARGQGDLPLITTSGAVSGANDAAGRPFWFNGQGRPGFNPALLASSWGKKVTYDATQRIDSGLPLAGSPKPLTVTFKKTGRFTFFCDVHPGMKGTVKVVGRRRHIPSSRQNARSVKRQVASALRTAKRLTSTKPPAGTVSIGAAGAGGVESFAFYPASLTVAPGATVTFSMAVRSREVHTATTGPGNPETEPGSYLGKLAASLTSPSIDPAAIYPSDVPGTPASLTKTSHGNGFWSSGALDNDKGSPLPAANRVTFTEPGTYELYCLIHPFMHGRVVVKP